VSNVREKTEVVNDCAPKNAPEKADSKRELDEIRWQQKFTRSSGKGSQRRQLRMPISEKKPQKRLPFLRYCACNVLALIEKAAVIAQNVGRV